METDRYQKELFVIDEPKKTFLGLGGIFRKKPDVFTNKPAFVLTPERIIFALIGIVMILVMVYALGVERGKSLKSGYQATKQASTVNIAAVRTSIVKREAPVNVKLESVRQSDIIKTGNTAKMPVAKNVVKKAYTIVVATFSSKENAFLSQARLKQNGFDSFIIQNGTYYRLCTGAYETKESALGFLNKVKRLYKDAYCTAK